MRRRFFFIIFAVLAGTIAIVSILQQVYFASERLRIADQRLETISSSLIASGLSLDLIQNLESTDDLVSDLLGEERADMLINIYALDGELLAQNYTASAFPLTFTSKERWQTLVVEGREVRLLNLPQANLMVQVGLFLGPTANHWSNFFNERFFVFVSLISALLLAAAYLGSRVLFSPLRKLTLELAETSSQLDRKLGQSLSGFVIGPELSRLAANPGRPRRDDLEKLAAQIAAFLGKLETFTRSFQAQSAILTHELKTPLTVLKNYCEEAVRTKDPAAANEFGQKALREIDRLTMLINEFLQWSVLTSNPGKPQEVYAVKLAENVRKTVQELNPIHGARIEFSAHGDHTVFAMPDHVRQLASNLLSNALRYSNGKVECQVIDGRLMVRDFGPGLPQDVREHLGQPFNRGGRGGSGLGLAWILALCEKYKWNFKYESLSTGTMFCIDTTDLKPS